MAPNNLATHISRAISAFDSIKEGIEEKRIEVPEGTPTTKYPELISQIGSSGISEEIVEKFLKNRHEEVVYDSFYDPFTSVLKNGRNIFYQGLLTEFTASLESLENGTSMFFYAPIYPSLILL